MNIIELYNEGQRDFKGANLEGADLEYAYLRGANLRGANLRGVYLEGVNLRGAHLRGANLEGAHLRGANLDNVRMNWDSHNLISERLKQAAPNEQYYMMAASIATLTEYCWEDFATQNFFPHDFKCWAAKTMLTWLHYDEQPNQFIRKYIEE